VSKTLALLSTLHEGSTRHSGTREFRGRPVLDWTLSRLAGAERISQTVILCWQDQAAALEPVVRRHNGTLIARARVEMPHLDAISAARPGARRACPGRTPALATRTPKEMNQQNKQSPAFQKVAKNAY
jgi:hypothetical protein